MSTGTDQRPTTPPPRFAGLLATWFGVGLLPGAPGTWGSLAALPFAWVIASVWAPWGLAVLVLPLILVGWWASESYCRATGLKDPGPIVIDEVAGQWLTLAVLPVDLLAYAIGFVAFRAADVLKPWPASFADRRIRGGLGVMLDDVLAVLYAAPVAWIVYWSIAS